MDELTDGKVTQFYVASLHRAPDCTMEQEVVKHRLDQQLSQSTQAGWGR